MFLCALQALSDLHRCAMQALRNVHLNTMQALWPACVRDTHNTQRGASGSRRGACNSGTVQRQKELRPPDHVY